MICRFCHGSGCSHCNEYRTPKTLVKERVALSMSDIEKRWLVIDSHKANIQASVDANAMLYEAKMLVHHLESLIAATGGK